MINDGHHTTVLGSEVSLIPSTFHFALFLLYVTPDDHKEKKRKHYPQIIYSYFSGYIVLLKI